MALTRLYTILDRVPPAGAQRVARRWLGLGEVMGCGWLRLQLMRESAEEPSVSSLRLIGWDVRLGAERTRQVGLCPALLDRASGLLLVPLAVAQVGEHAAPHAALFEFRCSDPAWLPSELPLPAGVARG